MEENKDLCLEIKTQFENANSFKNNIGLNKDIKRSVMFENGIQWNMDDDIKEFPKITLNIIKQICKARMSNIMQNEYSYLINSTNFKSVRKIQDFLKHKAQSLSLRTKDLKSIKEDAIKGTAIGYFYWDAEKRGFLRKSGGDMRYENVDIRNFAVANEYIQNIQDQEWVIFVTREKINSLKAKYGKEINITPDQASFTSDTEKNRVAYGADGVDDELVNVFTKFYRNEEGQVYFVICTHDALLKKATPINPYYKDKNKSKEQPNTTSLNDEKEDQDPRVSEVWNLYPFVRLCLNERDNCFYGMPITLEYIEAQKSINNHHSIYDKALQDNVLGGFVYRDGVLDATELTTENGQMIALKTLPNESIANVFGRIPVANVPADSYKYSQSLMDSTRQVAGASNVQLGMADYAGQSGKQTQLLLQRAQENSSDSAMLFNQFKVDQANIMFLFAKFFYDNEDFSIIEHGVMKDQVREYKGENKFNGKEYIQDDVMIDIKVGTAPSFSEYTNLEMMGLMVQSGQLPVDAYITMLPDGYISNKQELLEIAKNNSNLKIQNLEAKLEQSMKIMEQMSTAFQEMQKDRKNIDMIIRENDTLKSQLAEVSAKAIQRVAKSDQEKQVMTGEMKNVLDIAKKNFKK